VPDAEAEFDRLYKLLDQHKKLALAVSGGSDSTALMVLAAQWARTKGRLGDICVLTVDHALRENSNKEAQQVCQWARALGLECHILVWQHDGHTAKIQEKARLSRYELMGQWCAENDVEGIVTAHNSDDQAETMLMRLARGSGVDGLAAMGGRSELFGAVVYRPLLDVSRQTLQDMLLEGGHSWIDDPSNYNEVFERVRVRGAMDAIQKAGIEAENINLSAKRLKRASRALDVMTDQFMAHGVAVFNSGHCEVDRQTFEALPDDIAIRVLSRLLEWAGGSHEPVRMAKIERLYEALTDSDQHTLGGARVALRKTSIVIGREFGRINTELAIGVDVWDNRFVFEQKQNVQPYGMFVDDDERQRSEHLPFFVICSLPVFINSYEKTSCKKERMVVPHLDFSDAGGVKLRSLPAGVAKVVAFEG